MSKTRRTQWTLPLVAEPETTRCFLIQIPDDPMYIAAFRGAIYEMAKPYAWGDDTSHTALVVAERMQSVFNTIQEVDCDLAVQTILRLSESGCGIDYSLDNGDTWIPLDLSSCIGGISDGRIQNAIDTGLIQGGVRQQSPQSAPAPGECHTYHARLAPGSLWHCPSPVAAGDTIHITNHSGGWSIGELAWYCGDGARYLVGACDAALYTHVSGDPLNPGAYHMALIGLVGSTFFDPLTTTYTIPAGLEETDFYIQANTVLTGVPSGEMSFDIEVCSGELWTHTFDFTVNNGSWYVHTESANNPRAIYSAGVGWLEGVAQYCQIQRDFTEATIIGMDFYNIYNAATNRAGFSLRRVGVEVRTGLQNTYDVVGGLYHRSFSFANTNADQLWISADNPSHGCGFVRVVITGRGTDPF